MANVTTAPPTYRKAMNELKDIVDRMRETEDVDVDELVKDVSRAKELLDFCGSKLTKAETEIQSVITALKVEDPDEPAVEEEPAEEPTVTSGGEEDIPF